MGHELRELLDHILAAASWTLRRTAFAVFQAQEHHRFFRAIQALIIVRRHRLTSCLTFPPCESNLSSYGPRWTVAVCRTASHNIFGRLLQRGENLNEAYLEEDADFDGELPAPIESLT